MRKIKLFGISVMIIVLVGSFFGCGNTSDETKESDKKIVGSVDETDEKKTSESSENNTQKDEEVPGIELTMEDAKALWEIEYDDDDKFVTIKKYIGSETDVTIPLKIGGKTVYTDCNRMFKGTKVVHVTIPSGNGYSLKTQMFEDCSDLKEVTYKSSSVISTSAFENCSSLETIKFSSNLTTIMEDAFRHCTSLKDIVLPDGVESIQNGAFAYCTFTNITIPSSVVRIGDTAFFMCSKELTIHGESGSYAETYANEKKINFVAE